MLHVAKSILKNRCWEGEMYNNKSYIYYIYYNIYNIYKIICNYFSNGNMKMQHATCNKYNGI